MPFRCEDMPGWHIFTSLSRRASLGCDFPACPRLACPSDVKICPGGTSLSRRASLGCDFPACPKPKPKDDCGGYLFFKSCHDDTDCCPSAGWRCKKSLLPFVSEKKVHKILKCKTTASALKA